MVENGRVVALDLGDQTISVGLTGSLPAELANLTKIRTLNLGNNQLTGTLSPSWSAFTNLTYLDLHHNQFTGSLPNSWSGLVNLVSLGIYDNKLTGSLPDSWSALVNLTQLWLNSNQFTGPLPVSWSSMVKLKVLSLQNNQLSGSLPDSWSSFVNMTQLFIENNQLSGILPAGWSSLVNLYQFYLNSNKITGSLPSSWSSLVNLGELDLNFNQLTGNMPASWASLTNLTWFALRNNQFTGTMPAGWVALVNLQYLELNNNQISGLPQLSALTRLTTFTVENNFLDFGAIEPNINLSINNFSYSPQAKIGPTATITKYSGEEFKVFVAVGGQHNIYQWFKNGISIPGANATEYVIPAVILANAGDYTCQITNTIVPLLTLTSNPITLQVLKSLPVANAGSDQSVNAGVVVTLNGSASSDFDGNPLTYRWTMPKGIILSSSAAVKPTFTAPFVKADTIYTFSLVVNNGTEDSPADLVLIKINYVDQFPCLKDSIKNSSVNFTFTPSTLDSRNNQLTCTIFDQAELTYSWDMGDGTNDTGGMVQHDYTISRTIADYTITLTATNKSGCVKSASKTIEVLPFIPNVFSPNGDGINDLFMPQLDLQIFDRAGTILYTGSSGWDGIYRGRRVDPDTYFYLIKFMDRNHNIQTRKGFITLVR